MPRPFTAGQLWDLANRRGLAVGPRPVEKARKPRSNEESRAQRAVVAWWNRVAVGTFGLDPQLLFSIPNGGGRSGPVVGSILKAEGLRKGAPDLMLAAPRGGYHGLFIEMKTEGGVVSREQSLFHVNLTAQGYRVEVCRNSIMAILKITFYLGP